MAQVIWGSIEDSNFYRLGKAIEHLSVTKLCNRIKSLAECDSNIAIAISDMNEKFVNYTTAMKSVEWEVVDNADA